MHPFAQQALGQLGVLPAGTHEIAEWTEDPAVEAFPDRQQRGGTRRQPDPVALELLQRLAASGELRKRFLGLAPVGPVQSLPLASLGHEMAGVIVCGGGPSGLQAEDVGMGHGAVAPSFSCLQLDLKAGAMGVGLGRPLAK